MEQNNYNKGYIKNIKNICIFHYILDRKRCVDIQFLLFNYHFYSFIIPYIVNIYCQF